MLIANFTPCQSHRHAAGPQFSRVCGRVSSLGSLGFSVADTRCTRGGFEAHAGNLSVALRECAVRMTGVGTLRPSPRCRCRVSGVGVCSVCGLGAGGEPYTIHTSKHSQKKGQTVWQTVWSAQTILQTVWSAHTILQTVWSAQTILQTVWSFCKQFTNYLQNCLQHQTVCQY